MSFDSLKVACINIRSLLPKVYDLGVYVHSNKLDVIIVVETWLNSTIADGHLLIDDYVIIRNDRPAHGGGVAIYCRNSLAYSIIDTKKNIEEIFLLFRIGNAKLAIGGIYRPPKLNYKAFLDELESSLVSILPYCDKIFCGGDFNIDCLSDNPSTIYFLDFLESIDFKQLIDQPTRLTASTASLIDLFIVSDESLVVSKGVVGSGLSDHDFIHLTIKLSTYVRPSTTLSFRNFKAINFDEFNHDLGLIPFQHIFYMANINDKVEFFSSCLLSLFDKHVPVVTRTFRKTFAPWLTDNLKLMISLRERARSKFRQTKNPKDWDYYKSLRNITTKTVRLEKKAYISHVANTRDKKVLWSHLGRLGVTMKDHTNIPAHLKDPEKLNHYFVSPSKTVHSSRDRTINSYLASTKYRQKFSFVPVDVTSIFNIIKNIKSGAAGSDNVSLNMIKLCCPNVLPYITHIVNICLTEDVFPDNWGWAIVHPIPKVSKPSQFTDLRPISLLPILSKIFERIVAAQLSQYIKNENILPPTQSGFRAGYSCETALTDVTDNIHRATDNGLVTCLVLLDYSKAFDTVNVEVLLAILTHIGFTDNALRLIKMYFTNRRQSVRVDGLQSTPVAVLQGVPQGSVLGPILYTIYTFKLLSCLNYCKSHSYADDIQLQFSFKPSNWQMALNCINADLTSLYSTSIDHCLNINPDKTKAILFGPKRICNNLSNVFHLKINGKPISIVNSAKSLGLHLDNTFRYREQISRYIRSAYLNLKRLYPFRHILNQKIKKDLCESFVLSQFTFCCTVYHGGLDQYTAARVQRVQNSCLRFIYGIRKFDHISHKLKSAGWLNMQDRRLVQCLTFYHKIIISKSPPYLYNKIRFRTDVHNLTTRYRNLISPPLHKTTMFKRSFSYQIYSLYNDIPIDIKGSTLSSFKIKLKQFLSRRGNG